MKTFTLKVTEEELEALIEHHAANILMDKSVERSQRIHDLMKRLHKSTPDIENDTDNAGGNQPQTKSDAWG